MKTKLVITCITDDVEFDSVTVECKHPISSEKWELFRRALPLVFHQAEANLEKQMAGFEETNHATMTADFQVNKAAEIVA